MNIKYTDLGSSLTTMASLTEIFANNVIARLNANPEMLIDPSVFFPDITRPSFLRLDTNGTNARKQDSTAVSALHALYGRPFIVSSLDSSDVWTNHGYVSGGRPYAHLNVYGYKNLYNRISNLDENAPAEGAPTFSRPFAIPTPFDDTTKAAANTVSGSTISRGTTFADMPTATQRRGYEVGIESLEGLVSSGDPGDTLFATPPVETIRLWMPELARTNPYFRTGEVASAGTVTYGDKDADYFFTGGRGDCTSHFDFTTGSLRVPFPTSGLPDDFGGDDERTSTYMRIDEAPECGPDGYAVCVYWEE